MLQTTDVSTENNRLLSVTFAIRLELISGHYTSTKNVPFHVFESHDFILHFKLLHNVIKFA